MADIRPDIRSRIRIYGLVALAALGGVVLTQALRSLDALRAFTADKDVLGNYLQLIGGIYAVVIGFVIFVVWNQFNDGTRAIEQEAGRLGALARLSAFMRDADHGKAIRKHIIAYTQAILGGLIDERSGRPESHADLKAWRELVRVVRSTPTQDDRDTAIYADILQQLDSLTTVRNERHSILRARIPWILWDLLVFASVVTILPFAVLSVESSLVDIMITASTAGSLAFLLLVVHDLDDPFLGVFNLSFEPFERLLSGEDLA
jgi:hypothetical protein